MHRTHLREILRDADIAHTIGPTVRRDGLSFAQTLEALNALAVPRAAAIAAIIISK